jgi:hypothetical protein
MLLTGCKSSVPAPGEAPIVESNAASTDPTMANLAAPVNGGVTRVAASSYNGPQQQGYAETYPQQQAAPNYGTGNSQQNEAYQYNTQQPASQGNPQADQAEYDQYASLLDPNVPQATQPPPPLPSDYEQPEAPGPDYLWTPGYWDYATAGYYYVPGTWVAAPYAGALWTPGWWGFAGGRYGWHHGYWGRHVGYYGGINYGFGYIGFGYQGGYWNGDHFWYNRTVLRVNPRVVGNNYYQRNITVNNREYVNNTRVSYFGGNGGLRRPPAPQEFAAIHEQHTPPMQAQIENRRAAESNRQQFFAANNGRPQMMYASHPLPADRNIQAPPRTMPQQNMEQQRIQQQQQANVQRNENMQQRNENLQQRGENLQQRDQNLQQRNAMEQQHNLQEQQRQQANVQRDQQMQQHNQQMQVQNQQRAQEEQQRNQQNQQRAQQEQQRNQQEQQRNQQEQQRNQQEQQRNQQANVQREQQMNAQRQQVEAQRQQEQQRNQQQQANQQREQQANAQRAQQQQQNAQREQQANAQRQQAMAQQHAQAAAPHPAPQHVEAPHPAPAPHVEAPHPAPPAAHGGGGAPEHRR